MLRVIGEIQPAYVVGENVRGLLNWSRGLVFDQVQADLEAKGYQIAPLLLPACAVDAPHRRDRIWFVAHAKSNGNNRTPKQSSETIEGQDRKSIEQSVKRSKVWTSTNASSIRTGSSPGRCNESRELLPSIGRDENQQFDQSIGESGIVTNPTMLRCGVNDVEREGIQWGQQTLGKTWASNTKNFWYSWPTQSPVCGGNDGIPNRVDRIKSLGNAIIPQVAFEIFKSIASVATQE